VVIHLPPLRERREDIPLLVERFVRAASAKSGKRVELSSTALDALATYHWPGNVRELENMIERLVVFSRTPVIQVSDLPPTVSPRAPVLEKRLFDDLPTLEEIERRYLVHVLEQVGGNRTRAAEVMGIDRRTLYRMAERFGIPLAEQPD
jgi:DNA-binding NtrC family response regulator